MVDELIKLMKIQEQSLQELLLLLDLQFKMIMDKDVFGLEGLVDKLGLCSKKIAKEEVERRNLLGENNLVKIVETSNNEKLKLGYKSINNVLKQVLVKKETNDILIKQNLVFNNKMLNILNPNREIKTYNSYGNLSK